jgi:hypothetical protein
MTAITKPALQGAADEAGAPARTEVIRLLATGGSRFPPLPRQLAQAMRRRRGGEEQATFRMLVAGIAPPEIAKTLAISPSLLESRLREMLRTREAMAWH